MRIISGKFRGINLTKSDHIKTLRPTTDKNRQALFNILSSAKFIKEMGFDIVDAEVLDVCCGTGAVGFEALSRGAKSVTFIENNRTHLELVQRNSENLHVENQVKILSLNAKNLPKNDKFFDLIFIDPPYEEDYAALIKSLLENNWIQENSLVVVEFKTTKKSENFLEKFGIENLVLLDERKYGGTGFAFVGARRAVPNSTI